MTASLMQRFDSFYKEAYGNSDGRWIDATPNNWQFIDDILHYFPHAKIIFILRNPLEVISSDYKRCKYFRDKSQFVREKASVWKKVAQAYVRYMDQGDKQTILLMRHDKFVRDPRLSLEKLFLFLGISPDNQSAYDELLYLPNRRDSSGRRQKFQDFDEYRAHFQETVSQEVNADLELCCKTMECVGDEMLAFGFNRYCLETVRYDLDSSLAALMTGAPCALFGATEDAKIILEFLNRRGIYPQYIKDNNIMNIKEQFAIPLRAGAHPVPPNMMIIPASRSSKFAMVWQLIEQHKLPAASVLLGFINNIDAIRNRKAVSSVDSL